MITYTLILAAVLFATVTTLLLFKYYFTDRRRMTSTTEGRVLRAEERSFVDGDLRRTQTEVVAGFEAWGRQFQAKAQIDGAKARAYPPGRVVPVRYNPGSPEMSEIIV